MYKYEKVYAVEFLNYTNCMEDTVSCGSHRIGTDEYLNVGKFPFLVLESQLESYRKYGGGYKSTRFVGNIRIKSELVENQEATETPGDLQRREQL